MKYIFSIFLIWACVNGAFGFFGTIFNGLSETAKKLTSNTADTACHVFADTVMNAPLNPPRIEEVGFQLRTPCKRIDVSANEAVKLRDIPEFDATKKTVIFVAGWITSLDKDYIEEVARAYHCRGGYNFIVANTGGFIESEYVNSAYYTNKLGEFLAVGLRNTGLPVEDIHLVGHSLGAHIVGSIGRHYEQLTNEKLLRITGLDPARPCFKTPAAFPRLTSDDAVFVDIMHSNPFDLGMEEVIGDADFYVTGLDVVKPGCLNISLKCSHELAIQYYLESVYSQHENSYIGSLCKSYSEISPKKCTGAKSIMGYGTSSSTKGIYYVPVKSKSPYGSEAQGDASFRDAACGRCQQ